MKKVVSALIMACICLHAPCLRSEAGAQDRYASREDWKAEFVLPKFAPNKEITGGYDASLAAKCVNGTFVGLCKDGVNIWKGIPYARQPVGGLRFKAPQPPEASDRVFEVCHFMIR